MGIEISCPFAKLDVGLDKGLKSVRLKSMPSLDPSELKAAGYERINIEASFGLDGRLIRIKSFADDEGDNLDRRRDSEETNCKSPSAALIDPKYDAAVKLQKVYKSFRTRRKLADCAVLVEQSWWKLLDFAELKRSSISFFDIEKQETAVSRWSRARTRAAKVGKGLSKNGKAQKLALQHWLEAIDPRHRYGHNLHFYYVKWLHSESREPFFYWLDIGEGKDINLVEKCSRWKLQKDCIKYMGPMERKAYEVAMREGKFYHKASGVAVHTTGEDEKAAKWIFVLSASKVLYIGKKKKGSFQHSSFLSGGAAIAAGRLVIDNGVLKAVWPYSGHYQPTEENFKDFISFLLENSVDITDVKMSPMDEDEHSFNKQKSSDILRAAFSDEDLDDGINSGILADKGSSERGDPSKLQHLAVQENGKFVGNPSWKGLLDDGYGSEGAEDEQSESSEGASKQYSSNVEQKEEQVLEEVIVDRIKAKKESKSFQLGKQLSCVWTTGAGPRISCVRDYPSRLQCQALERMQLSPRRLTSAPQH